ncbi:MAG: mechanosensitive ion channel family protein [Halobacteriota archaeon]
MLDRAREFARDQVEVLGGEVYDWLAYVVPRTVLALAVVYLGYRLSNLVVRYAGRPVYQRVPRESVAAATIRVIKYGVVLASLLVALRLAYGFTLTSVLLTATVFSVVLGVVLAPLVGDIINGIFVLGDQPYEIGDMVELDTGTLGFVEDVTIRYTKIFTMDNTFMVIPNSEIRRRDVDNYSAEDVRTRQTIDVSVTYESDVDLARELVERAARDTPEVISTEGDVRIGKARYPLEPKCFVREFGDHGMHLRLRYWVREPYRLLQVKSSVNEKIWSYFGENDVRVPYPHRHHIFDNTTGVLDVDADADGDERRRGSGGSEDGE